MQRGDVRHRATDSGISGGSVIFRKKNQTQPSFGFLSVAPLKCIQNLTKKVITGHHHPPPMP